MTEENKQSKRKRRSLRFSLRTFVIVLTILCVWIGWYLLRVEQQREAVKWVLENGGTVDYDYEFDLNDVFIIGSQPSVPKWLYNMLGVDYFSSATQVRAASTRVSDVTSLANLKNLKYLHLGNTQVNDLAALASRKKPNHPQTIVS